MALCVLASLRTAWSFKNRPTRLSACGVFAAFAKPADSISNALSRGRFTCFSIDSNAIFGAGYCAGLAFENSTPLAELNAIACSKAFNLTGLIFSSWRAFQSRSPAIHFLTKSIAEASSWSAATTASTIPTFNAAAGFCASPVAMISKALSIPMIRGKRTEPPKPGKIPNLTSGKPMLALSLMTR